MNQIVVGELVVFLPWLGLQNGIAVRLFPFRVGRRDQADFAVENADQVVEVPGAVGITGGFQQFLRRSHLPLDVGAGLGQQGFQDRLCRLLVESMLRIGLR